MLQYDSKTLADSCRRSVARWTEFRTGFDEEPHICSAPSPSPRRLARVLVAVVDIAFASAVMRRGRALRDRLLVARHSPTGTTPLSLHPCVHATPPQLFLDLSLPTLALSKPARQHRDFFDTSRAPALLETAPPLHARSASLSSNRGRQQVTHQLLFDAVPLARNHRAACRPILICSMSVAWAAGAYEDCPGVLVSLFSL